MLAFYACKDERNLPLTQRQDHYVQVTAADAPLVQKQLAWIAKGLAGIADQNPSVKAGIHDLILSSNYFTQSNLDIDNELQNTTGFDYDQEVDQWLQQNQPGNDYDQDYFFDIDIDDCEGTVSVLIPEADIVDGSKLHVVTVSDVFQEAEMSIGYFLTSGGTLDSLIIRDGNMDSVYLWIVGVESDCPEDSLGGVPNPERGCNDDGDCEPYNGEAWPDCPDCPEPLPSDMKLELKSLHLNTDYKRKGGSHPGRRYQEAHLQGKYDVRFSYAITNVVVKHSIISNWGSPLRDLNFKEKGFTAWGKDCDIKRTNNRRNKSNRGKIWVMNCEWPLAADYEPLTDSLIFTLYEKDNYVPQTQFNSSGGITSNGKGYSYNNATGSSFVIVPPDAISINDPSYNGPWKPVGTNEWEAYFELDEEMSLTFTLKL